MTTTRMIITRGTRNNGQVTERLVKNELNEQRQTTDEEGGAGRGAG